VIVPVYSQCQSSVSKSRGSFPTATLLNNGKVLVAGGGLTGRTSAEIYDPSTGTFSATDSMVGRKNYHSGTLLGSGKVLIVRGNNNSKA